MITKIIYAVLGLGIIFTGIYYYTNQHVSHTAATDTINKPDKPEPQSKKKPEKQDQTEQLIDKIFSAAEKGRIPDGSITAGETAMTDIRQDWGDSKSIQFNGSEYTDYSKQKITVGHRRGIIFDIRSFADDLGNIHLNAIKKLKGDPDTIHYYKDKKHDQIILVYKAGDHYQLKWIMPKPSDKSPDPAVHHISVYAKPEKAPQTDDKGGMSLDEKIGQMIMAGFSGSAFTDDAKRLIQDYHVGGMILYKENMTDPKQAVNLINQIKTANKNNAYPLLLGVDQEGGAVSRLPGNLQEIPTNQKIGSWDDPEKSYEIGMKLGKQVRAFGFNLDFAPVLDVNSNSANPVIGNRSFGADPKLVSRLGIQTMKGIQSNGIIPVVKHFPGHGDTSVDSHLQLPTVNKNLKDLQSMELIPFVNAIKEGADAVMEAHILLPKLDPDYPASMSKKITDDLLRKRLGFDGVVITDDMTMGAITANYEIGNAAVKSVQAGSDVILVAHEYQNAVAVFEAIKKAVNNGEISTDRINQSVKRIAALKANYDLSDEKTDMGQIQALLH